MTIAYWTVAEEERLKELYASGMSGQEIADLLGRTRAAVHMRATRLGLRASLATGDRSRAWIAIRHLCRDRVGRTVHELSDAVGVTRENVDYLMRTRHGQGKAHVVRFEKGRGKPRPVWLPFPGVDAERPASTLSTVRHKRYQVRRPEPAKPAKPAKPVPLIVPTQHEVIRALFGMGAPT